MTETFYDVLGVSEDATTDEIQSAYRDRLKEVHPDVSDDDDAGAATQRLVAARDVLVDEDERARYDRLGHEGYVSDGSSAAAAAESTTETEAGTSSSTGGGRQGTQDRSQRERRAGQRVREERAARRSSTTANSAADRATADRTTTATTGGPTTGDRQGYGPNGATSVGENTYNVRTEVEKSQSFGPILPSGQRLTLLGIFFALYPLLLFSALLPAFPLFVNVVVGGCALVFIGYLQSMPRISLLVFGGWSAISVTFLLLLGVEFLSLLGLAVLSGTVLPFGFSLLTAWALRY
jgi:curved DNA-binding protein CbpA